MGSKVKWERGAWWVVTHYQGKRKKRRIGPTKTDKRQAEEIAKKINAALTLGTYAAQQAEKNKTVPFTPFAKKWLRREVMLPIERGEEGHLAPGTAHSYTSHVQVHLVPYFGDQDLQSIDIQAVQTFRDHCIDAGKPRSSRTIEMVIATLGMILSHAQMSGLVESNAVAIWKKSRPKRRRSSLPAITPDKVLNPEELQRVLDTAKVKRPDYFPLFLFLADTGARIGEATALRWTDVDLEQGTARIARSYSMGRFLGPTKSGRERTVELSTRLREVLQAELPDIYGDETLVFLNDDGGFIDQSNFRNRIFMPIVRKALGRHRRFSPHGLRHSFASIHLSRGTNLLWVQRQGGWTSPAVLLSTYAHFVPTELGGYADALTAPDGTIRHQARHRPPPAKRREMKTADRTGTSEVGPQGEQAQLASEPWTDGLKVHFEIEQNQALTASYGSQLGRLDPWVRLQWAKSRAPTARGARRQGRIKLRCLCPTPRRDQGLGSGSEGGVTAA